MAIYKSILDLVGGTPLVELTQFEKENDLKATVWRSWSILTRPVP